jgi:hypothetical protein
MPVDLAITRESDGRGYRRRETGREGVVTSVVVWWIAADVVVVEV